MRQFRNHGRKHMPASLRACAMALLLCIGLSQAQAQTPTVVMVPMRDGVKLATDIYRPTNGTRRPAILNRTPYGRRDHVTLAQNFYGAGYSMVVQDTRGTGGSEGTKDGFLGEGWGTVQDGYDTVEWVAAQDWCNGKVGMLGVSAQGQNIYLAAAARPPSLKAAVAVFAPGDTYHRVAYPGGELRKEFMDGWMVDNAPLLIPQVIAHATRDAWWDESDALMRASTINVPILHVGGWYDIFAQGTIDMFTALQERGDTGARGNQKLVMGPWVHGGHENRVQGQLQYPANATDFPLLVRADDWFEYWLKGIDNGIMNTTTVRYYRMGAVGEANAPGNAWLNASGWPPGGIEATLYLGATGTLTGKPPAGPAARPRSYIYDPAKPVPTIGGANLKIADGPRDQRPVESRSDVLVFTSEQLTEALAIAGTVRAEIHAASSAIDTD